MTSYFDYIQYTKSNRCQSKNSTNNKRCLNRVKKLYFINNKYICNFHTKHIILTMLFKIYDYYCNSYKRRIKFKNIYLNLPCDIQSKIKFYIHENYYNEKFNNSVIKLVKFKLTMAMLRNIEDIISVLDSRNYLSYINSIENYLCNFIKYYKYLTFTKKEYDTYYENFINLRNIINNIKYNYNYDNDDNFVIDSNINIEDLNNIISYIKTCENHLNNCFITHNNT